MYTLLGSNFSSSAFGVPVYVPIVFKKSTTYSSIPEEIREKIEEHKDEFENERDLKDFVRLQMLKA